MEIKQEYEPPKEQPKSRSIISTLFSIVLALFSFLMLPFRFAKKGIGIIKEDVKKKDAFRKFLRNHNVRRKRQRRLSDEF